MLAGVTAAGLPGGTSAPPPLPHPLAGTASSTSAPPAFPRPLVANLSLTPTAGGLATPVVAAGSGFGTNSTVALTFGGGALANGCYSNYLGDLVGAFGGTCNFTVPLSASVGSSAVAAVGWSNANATPVGAYPSGIAVDTGRGQVFVADESSNTVTIYWDSNGSLATTVTGTVGADACAYDPAQGVVFVADGGSNNVSVINDTSDTLVANLTGTAAPTALAYDPAKDELFVADGGASNVTVVNAANDTTVANVTVGVDPVALAYDAGRGEVFAGVWGPNNVSVINDTNDSIVANIWMGWGGTPASLAYAPSVAEVFVGEGPAAEVAAVSDRTDTIVGNVSVGWDPEGLAFDPALGEIFSANWGPNNVSVINVTNDTLVATLAVGISPQAAAFDPDTGAVIVANQWSNNVTPITEVAQGQVAFTVDPTLLLSPTAGPPGSSLAASGIGLGSNATVSLEFGGTSVRTSCATDATGRFPGGSGTACTFVVPAWVAGAVTVQASDGTHTVHTSYRVTPSLNLSLSSGAVGSIVSATGAGFGGSQSVAFTVAGARVSATCVTDASGSFPGTSGSACTFTVPASPYGADAVTASDGTNVQNATFFVTSALGLAPGNGTVGGVVSVSGSGFDPNSTITFTVAGRSVRATCATDGNGQFPGTSGSACNLTVPEVPGGPEVVRASDGVHAETGVYLVNESLALSVEKGAVGSNVGVTALGGAPNASLDLTLGGQALPVACFSDRNGTYPSPNSSLCSFAVPSLPAGPQRLNSLGMLASPNVSLDLGGNLDAVAVDPGRSELFVANAGNGTVAVVSEDDDTVLASIPVGGSPSAMVYDPATDQVFVGTDTGLGGSVDVIDAANDSVVATVGVPVFPSAMVYDAGHRSVYVVGGYGNVTAVSAVNDSVVASVPTGQAMSALAYDPALGEIFVGGWSSNNLTVLNDTTNAEVANVSLGDTVSALAYDTGTDQLFVAPSGANTIEVLDAANGTVAANITVGFGTNALAYAPGSGEVLASVYGPGQIVALSDANDSTLGAVSTSWGNSGTPFCVAVDPDDGLAYAGNGFAGNVTVISDPSTSLAFNITASLALVLPGPSADTGETITVAGSGFASAARVPSMTIGSIAVSCVRAIDGSCVAGNLTTLADGSFAAQVVVPATLAAGTYNFTALDSLGNNAHVRFTVDLDPAVGAVAMNRTEADVGQAVTLTAPVSAGSGGYRFVWHGLPAGCSSATRATVNCTVTVPGNYSITAVVTDSDGVAVTSPVANLTVWPDPQVAIPGATPGTGAVDAGQAVSFGAVATLGTGTYGSYTWAGLPSGCQGTATAAVACSGPALAAGTFGISVAVTDSDNFTSRSSPVLAFVIDSDPVVTAPTPSRASADLGQGVTFTVTAGGGSGQFSYAWSGLPNGCSTASTDSLACMPTGAGSFSVAVVLTDSNQYSVSSPSTPFEVYPNPSVALSANRTTVDVGEAVGLTATPSGGSGGYTVSWSGLPPGCGGSGGGRTCVPTRPGNYTVRATLTDSDGGSAASLPVLLVVAPSLVAAPFASVAAPAPGEVVTFTANATGGTGPVTYAWAFGDGATGAGSTFDHSYANAGTYSVTLWVNDSTGASVRATLNVTVQGTPGPSGGNAGLFLAAIAVLVVAVAGVVGLALRRRRNAPPPRAEAPEEGDALPVAPEEPEPSA